MARTEPIRFVWYESICRLIPVRIDSYQGDRCTATVTSHRFKRYGYPAGSVIEDRTYRFVERRPSRRNMVRTADHRTIRRLLAERERTTLRPVILPGTARPFGEMIAEKRAMFALPPWSTTPRMLDDQIKTARRLLASRDTTPVATRIARANLIAAKLQRAALSQEGTKQP